MKFNDTVFIQKTVMFEKVLTRFIKLAASAMYKGLVAKVADVINMEFSRGNNQKRFYDSFPLYATDVMFQPASRPFGIMPEAEPYFTG